MKTGGTRTNKPSAKAKPKKLGLVKETVRDLKRVPDDTARAVKGGAKRIISLICEG